jgi:hypothetical protein
VPEMARLFSNLTTTMVTVKELLTSEENSKLKGFVLPQVATEIQNTLVSQLTVRDLANVGLALSESCLGSILHIKALEELSQRAIAINKPIF